MLPRADRAYIPREALGILTSRTLANSHPQLLALLRPGQDVLDVGCGPGTLTIETARRVLPGRVVGLDVNREALASARETSPPPSSIACRADLARARSGERASG